jgi:hypothetical protein
MQQNLGVTPSFITSALDQKQTFLRVRIMLRTVAMFRFRSMLRTLEPLDAAVYSISMPRSGRRPQHQ